MIARFNTWATAAQQRHPVLYALCVVVIGVLVATAVSLSFGVGVPWFGLMVFVVVGVALQLWILRRNARL